MNRFDPKALKIKLFADGAEKAGILEMYANPLISGFTTNPTLMKKAGIKDYEAFAKDVLSTVRDKGISFEVFSDEFEDMERQAMKIAAWGANVYVKIPITNTKGASSVPLIDRLSRNGVKLNVTAMMTPAQVRAVLPALSRGPGAIVSVFAGRIADAGVDPLPLMKECLGIVEGTPQVELLWASPREIFNLVQADQMGCHIITMTNDLIRKISSLGKDLDQFSVETVQMFFNDGASAGYRL